MMRLSILAALLLGSSAWAQTPPVTGNAKIAAMCNMRQLPDDVCAKWREAMDAQAREGAPR